MRSLLQATCTTIFLGTLLGCSVEPPAPTVRPVEPEPSVSEPSNQATEPDPGSSDPGSSDPGSSDPGDSDPGDSAPEPGTPEPSKPEPAKPESPETTKPEPDEPAPKPPADPKSPPEPQDAATNGPQVDKVLFENWPEPLAAILVTGRQHGYIEPCGCTGLANQKGGLSRRHTLKRQLEKRNWPLVLVDVGNQVRRSGRQPEIKFQIAVEGFRTIGYHAIGYGPDDLNLSAGDLVAAAISNDDTPSPFMSANVTIIEESFTPKFRVVAAGGKRIGITAVLGDEHRKEIRNTEILHRPAVEGLTEVWKQLEAEKCDYYVLVAHTGIEESLELGTKFPKFDLVVTAGGAGEPTFEPQTIPKSQGKLIQAGAKGMYAGVVGLFADPEKPIRYQRIPLDARFEDSVEMLRLLAAYQEQLKDAGLEKLGIKPLPHTSGHTFVGSEACRDCHEGAFDVWKDSRHFHATDSLVNPGERSDIPRHFDPECLSCHVTGWNPQKYYPYTGGYLRLEDTKVHNVGCENCHGPGSAHVAAENGDIEADEKRLMTLRQEMVLTLKDAEQHCMTCHDLDNSPDFDFQAYWEQIKHYAK